MAYFPILIDWQGVPCLIAGGGAVALHKARLLCGHGADVTVTAPEICPQLEELPVKLCRRPVTSEDVNGQCLVIDATGDGEAERMLSVACRERHVPFNSACRGGDGTVVFPAVRRKGRTMLAVSTLGASPAACALLGDRLAGCIPDGIDPILEEMAALRPLSREWFEDQPTRKRFLHRCLDDMMEKERLLEPEEIERIRQEITGMEKTEEEEK